MFKTLFLGLIMTLATACGGNGSGPSAPPAPTPAPGPAPTDAQVTAIIQTNCAQCHNGSEEPSLLPLTTFKASKAKTFLASGQMPPPPKTISAGDKATLLTYLNH